MLIRQNCKLILASTSKIRKKILEDIGLEFETIAPVFDEEKFKESIGRKINKNFSKAQKKEFNTPQKMALFLAKKKALSISKIFSDHYVIGSDQVCEFEKKEISKSKNFNDAINQLKKFNNKTHYQNNAVVVAFNNKIIFKCLSQAELKMRKLSDLEIESYVKNDKSWGCAGSYKYESMGKHLFEKVQGDYYSILGIAIQPLISFFHKKNFIKINQSN